VTDTSDSGLVPIDHDDNLLGSEFWTSQEYYTLLRKLESTINVLWTACVDYWWSPSPDVAVHVMRSLLELRRDLIANRAELAAHGFDPGAPLVAIDHFLGCLREEPSRV
jgi:hypothetical protein